MLIDTHAHVNFKQYDKDREETIERALAQDIWIINVGADHKTSVEAVNIAQFYAEGVYAAVGAHPTDAIRPSSGQAFFDFDEYEKLAGDSKVVAIGETGLDYFHIKDKEERVKQEELFLRHLDLAQKLNKPIILHCRQATPKASHSGGRAHQDLIKILKKTARQESGIIHCFSGDLNEAKEYMAIGLLIGFNGIITFSRDYDKIIKEIPLEKIVIETDCPYLTPIPFRGKRNEPAYVKYVAEKIAEIKDLDFKEVSERTTENAKRLFKI